MVNRSKPRAGWGTITRERLVSAALEETRTGRKVTIRSLAAGLGVAPMSLYRHVGSLHDLLAAVTDELIREGWRPEEDPADTRVWIGAACLRLRRLLITHPAAMATFLARPVTTRAALERMHYMTWVLEQSGMTTDQAQRAYSLIHVWTVGFSALEVGRQRWLASAVLPDDPDTARLAALTSDALFRDGLAALLDGLGVS